MAEDVKVRVGEAPREAWYSLGIVCEELGEYAEAENRFRQAAAAYADAPDRQAAAFANADEMAGMLRR
jgi:Flp pilus assembly protein TadD